MTDDSTDTSTSKDNNNANPNEATAQELQWAITIKEAALADPEMPAAAVGDMADFEFLQHAIVAKNKVDKALLYSSGRISWRTLRA